MADGKPGLWTAMGAVGTLLGGVAAVATLAKVWFDPAPDGGAQNRAEQTSTANGLGEVSGISDNSGGRASGQAGELESLVRSYLDRAQQNQGGDLAHAPGLHDEVTSLSPGQEHRWQLNLNAGTSYRVIGGCDNECRDLDLQIVDARGGVMASDTSVGDFPVVSFTPASSGPYLVRIIMADCTIAPCYAGARALIER